MTPASPCLTRSLLVAAVAGLALAAPAERFPAAWPETATNVLDVEGQPRWSLLRAWPDSLDAAAGFEPLAWKEGAWRPATNLQGGMPSIGMTEQGLKLTAGGRWQGKSYLKIPVIAYRAPSAGTYGIAGTATMRYFSGGSPVELRVLIRSATELRRTSTLPIDKEGETRLGQTAAELAAGEELVLALVTTGDNTGVEVTLRDLAIGTELADADVLARRKALSQVTPGVVVAQPTPEQLRTVNDAVAGAGCVFPPDANVLNVKAFGAVGDGVHDDTAAIQAAYNRTGLIYLPDGTYLLTAPIKAPPRRSSASCRRILQGQSRDKTILKLMDRAPGFGNPTVPQAVLTTSWGLAQAFRNSVRDLTIDVGTANPGAIGLAFFASNQGNVENITIRSSDPEGLGHTGLSMTGDNGPMLLRNVRIQGFETGILGAANQLATLEHFVLEGQRKVGLRSTNKTFIRGLTSRNRVPAIQATGQFLIALDARLEGGEPGTAAVTIGGPALLRRLSVEGYGTAIAGKDGTVPGPEVALWSSRDPLLLGTAQAGSVELPVEEPPTVPWDAPEAWANAARFVPETVTVKHKGTRSVKNWASAIQQAIDSGATTVCLPAGANWEVAGPIHLRGKVRRLIGCESDLRPVVTQPSPVFIVEDGEGDTVVIERFDTIYAKLNIEHRSKRKLVVRHMVVDHIVKAEGSGDLFLDDVCNEFLDIEGGRAWARQLNQEGSCKTDDQPPPRPNTFNNGGQFWLYGLKTEQNRTKIWTRNGGTSEIYAYILANRNANPLPMFVAEDAKVAVGVCESVGRNAPFTTILQTINQGTPGESIPGMGPGRQGISIPWATAVPAQPTP